MPAPATRPSSVILRSAELIKRAVALFRFGAPAAPEGIYADPHYRTAIDNLPQGLCLYDSQHRLLLANKRFVEIYSQPAHTLRPGTSFKTILTAGVAIGNYGARSPEGVWADRKAFIDRKQPGIFLQEKGDGRLIAIHHQPLPDGGWLVTYEDITEQRENERRTKFLADHDPLTLLPNRRHFEERFLGMLADVVGHNTRALLLIDLDGFKSINDVHGHAAGDRLLRRVADRLSAEVRDCDIVGRLGGDEFAVLLPNSSLSGAVATAERFIAAVRIPYDLAGCGNLGAKSVLI